MVNNVGNVVLSVISIRYFQYLNVFPLNVRSATRCCHRLKTYHYIYNLVFSIVAPLQILVCTTGLLLTHFETDQAFFLVASKLISKGFRCSRSFPLIIIIIICVHCSVFVLSLCTSHSSDDTVILLLF